MVWVNIDKPTKKCTIHIEDCIYVEKKSETPYKGIEELKRDGGWRKFDGDNDAVGYCKLYFGNYSISSHCLGKRLATLQQAKNNERGDKPNFINIEEKSGNSTFMVNVDAMIWVNIDKPTKKCTIHNKDCTFAKNKEETKLKGIGSLKRDGGWLSFKTEDAAENYCQENYNNYYISKHCILDRPIKPTGGTKEPHDKTEPIDEYNVYDRFYTLIMDKISDLFKAQKLDFLEALEALKKEVRTQGEEFKSDIEEKIDSMYGEIISSFTDVRRENISAEQDDQYLLEIKNELIDQWNMLDGGTQEMLPIARYLHEVSTQKAGIGAYPLAVLQYCRCLENELLVKIYQTRNPKGKTFGGLLYRLRVLSDGEKNYKNRESEYKKLRKFLERHFDIDKLLSECFLVELEIIVDYRNKAAHMKPLGSEDADKCRKKVMAGLRDFLNAV